MNLGTKIEKLRLDRGMTLSEFARYSGVTKGQISRIEIKGELSNPTLRTLRRIARGLKVNLKELL